MCAFMRGDQQKQQQHQQASLALIDYRLGVIALAVEEPSAAQEALESCAVSCGSRETPKGHYTVLNVIAVLGCYG